MSWKTGLGYGLLVWAVIFAVASAAMSWGVYESVWGMSAMVVIAAAASYVFAAWARLRGGNGFAHGLIWAGIALVLDYLVSYRFDTTLFASWSVWIGYAAIVAGPLIEAAMATGEHKQEHYPVRAG